MGPVNRGKGEKGNRFLIHNEGASEEGRALFGVEGLPSKSYGYRLCLKKVGVENGWRGMDSGGIE